MTDCRRRVALQGFSPFERSALTTSFRLAGETPAYEAVDSIDEAHFIVADADHPGVLDAVLAAGRTHDTIFVGAHAPDGALAWMLRPIDPMHVLRSLDAMLALREPGTAPREFAAPQRSRGPVPARRANDAVIESLGDGDKP